jgi:molecular chaperone DnaK
MVEESVEHAFEDLAARRWIEAKLKANELISATCKGLADCANELDAEYKAQVETVLKKVTAALESENVETKTGDVKQLQSASAKLDEATKTLADLLMEKATDALLRKRGLL